VTEHGERSDEDGDLDGVSTAYLLLAGTLVLLWVLLLALVAATLFPLPEWVFWSALSGMAFLALAAGIFAYWDARLSGRPMLVSLWQAVRASVGFFVSTWF
jgi:hypothetical protein